MSAPANVCRLHVYVVDGTRYEVEHRRDLDALVPRGKLRNVERMGVVGGIVGERTGAYYAGAVYRARPLANVRTLGVA